MQSPDSSNQAKSDKGTFDTTIRAWLAAMEKAKRIKPGGRLLFVNRRTGATE